MTMGRRKTICLMTAFPEGTHQSRIISGVISQCRRYDYNLVVLSSSIHLHSPRQRYLLGEINIYSLLNQNEVDGIILDTAALCGDNNGLIFREITDPIIGYSRKPIVSIEMPWEHYHVIENENEEILRETVRHVVTVHGKRKLCILTGHENEPISHSRLKVFLDEARWLGINVPEEYIVFGDFWYTGGEMLANRFLSGELEMPEAVICASDHMALGLMKQLTRNGVRVPEDIIVMGFEACPEALCNDIPLSSFEANDVRTAADAVNYLRSVIEPDEPVFTDHLPVMNLFHPGMSCGCASDYLASAHAFKDALYLPNSPDQGQFQQINIGMLMESYISEDLTATKTPSECLFTVLANAYLVYPFRNVYLCLAPDWLNMRDDTSSGYPDRMKIVMRCSDNNDFSFASEEGQPFDTRCMLPQLHEDFGEPTVFYFSPMHFNEHMLGYCVLQRSMQDTVQLNLVYKNWLRFVNNALEMTRAKDKLMHMSIRDEMTGAYNRRGLYLRLEEMLKNREPDAQFFAAVIDLDSLKRINDTYGHNEGDFAICTVAAGVTAVKLHNEICVRAGGDEFYIVGVGQYAENAPEERASRFSKWMEQRSVSARKPYPVTASIGCIVCPITDSFNVDEAIHRADEIMYACKVKRKLQRIV